ncbi:MAG TPA: UDP-N-acetylglucosamine--N-acetylmuramyl-(pentapeptide) pyrophosphoryl-undecaprenol N-acetylglucosamine transferase, partial [Candidatus Cloacimonadota bacterium]|nr:UDP-N-acetylglucosamine--N-acetylmuramyl-(pentapeptide) pyrophosphoryl-undecaprenol N-acetylglucosamine transferase [Candidatus Cloacimonadota bacterium]
FKPDGVITTGGFVAGPVAIAGLLSRIPCFLHESNSFPGLTTRYLAPYHRRVFISFDQTKQYLKGARLTNHGIPLMQNADKSEINLGDLGLELGRKTLLITGGSQGSLALNKVISLALPRLLELGWQVIWQTGKTSYQQFSRLHDTTRGLFMFDFHPQLRQMMNSATLAITRAGAMTIAELEAAHLPAILIPLPSAAENHQYYNARAQEDKGLARLLKQSDLNPDTLVEMIQKLDLTAMQTSLKALPPNGATQMIINDILQTYKE